MHQIDSFLPFQVPLVKDILNFVQNSGQPIIKILRNLR